MTPEESLELNFREALELPGNAIEYLLDVWHFIQVMDDAADGDMITSPDLDRAIDIGLCKMALNSFYDAHKVALFPALTMMILKWRASDVVERAGAADARSYMWRAGYYDVVMMVVYLVHGNDGDKMIKALSLYGEAFEDYMQEFGAD